MLYDCVVPPMHGSKSKIRLPLKWIVTEDYGNYGNETVTREKNRYDDDDFVASACSGHPLCIASIPSVVCI